MAKPRKDPTPPATTGQPAQQGEQPVADEAPLQQPAEQPEQLERERLMGLAAGYLAPAVSLQTATEPLDDFLRRVERVHIERDVVATAATHPHASERVWPGTYGGIRLAPGPASVTYSDGTTE